MFSVAPSRIASILGTGLVVISLAVGVVGGSSVAYGMPNTGPTGRGCEALAGPMDLKVENPRIVLEGTVMRDLNGQKNICVNGKWVKCGDISLNTSQQNACAAGIFSGGGQPTIGTPSKR
jgi:hypothetical protein